MTDKVYGFKENKSKVEVTSKEEFGLFIDSLDNLVSPTVDITKCCGALPFDAKKASKEEIEISGYALKGQVNPMSVGFTNSGIRLIPQRGGEKHHQIILLQ